jgi:cysteine desulfurase
MEIYFDNSATTRVCREAADKAIYMMTECYGNPSSLHRMGFNAEKEMTGAREAVASKIGVNPAEVYFTSGGTESNNLSIFGAAHARAKRGNRIVTTMIEHPSVLNAMKKLEDEGFEVVYLKPGKDGTVEAEDVIKAIDEKTILVSMMAVNNETGAFLPIDMVAKAIKDSGSHAIFHVDDVQGFGKLKINIKKCGIDLMSVSGHKIHAPKGVGAVYINEKIHIQPVAYGGGQEKNIRPGTEAVPNICAMGEAVRCLPEEAEEEKAIAEIHDTILERLRKTDGIVINSPEKSSDYILNFSVPGIRGETMLHFLEEREIYVSTGSACSRSKPSHVLEALGFDRNISGSAIRLSFSRYNKITEVEPFLEALSDGIKSLQHTKR